MSEDIHQLNSAPHIVLQLRYPIKGILTLTSFSMAVTEHVLGLEMLCYQHVGLYGGAMRGWSIY
jgi:hypothetical protein